MSTNRIGRRELLVGAGAGTVALATLGVAATPAAADSRETESLLGAWMITHIDDPGPGPAPTPSQSVSLFGGGGVFISRDIKPPGSSQLGAWTRTGDHRFAATFWDDTGDHPPNGTFKVTLNGSWSGDEVSGTFKFWVFDGNGTNVFSGAGTFTGTRIEAD